MIQYGIAIWLFGTVVILGSLPLVMKVDWKRLIHFALFWPVAVVAVTISVLYEELAR